MSLDNSLPTTGQAGTWHEWGTWVGGRVEGSRPGKARDYCVSASSKNHHFMVVFDHSRGPRYQFDPSSSRTLRISLSYYRMIYGTWWSFLDTQEERHSCITETHVSARNLLSHTSISLYKISHVFNHHRGSHYSRGLSSPELLALLYHFHRKVQPVAKEWITEVIHEIDYYYLRHREWTYDTNARNRN